MPTISRRLSGLCRTVVLMAALCLCCPPAKAQDIPACDAAPSSGTVWRKGDDPAWAKPALCLTGWESFSTFSAAPAGIFWIRSTFDIGTPAHPDGAVLAVTGAGAFEVYFDGVLLGATGAAGQTSAEETPGRLTARFGVPRDFLSPGSHVVAVRASANLLRDPSKFSITYNVLSRTEQHFRDTVNTLTLGAALAAVMLLIAFYAADARSAQSRFRFLPPLGLAVSIAALAALETVQNAGLIPYPLAFIIEIAAAAATLIAAVALPAFYLSQVDTTRKALWAGGAVIAAALASPAWPNIPLDHDARIFVALCLFCLVLIAAAKTASQERRLLLAGPALCLVAIVVDPQSLYLFLAALSVVLAVDFSRSIREREEKVQQAELAASRFESALLRRNLQPHFIMNSLTAVAEWIETAPQDALRFVYGLADEFRVLNRLSDKKLAPISDEIDLCNTHLQLMSMRLRRPFQLEVSGISGDEEVPPAIFLTLLENALSHNHYGYDGAIFTLAAHRSNRNETFRFTAPLGDQKTYAERSTHMGLRYIRSRLEESFPRAWSLTSNSDGDAWVTEIRISHD